MSAESLNLKLFYHHGTSGGHCIEGGYIRIKEEDGKKSRGIHFHHTEHLTPEQATEFMRKHKLIAKHETVLVVVDCGKGRNGSRVYAARTDGMAEPKEQEFQSEPLGKEWGVTK